jgi:hypothetical protein
LRKQPGTNGAATEEQEIFRAHFVLPS